MRLSDMPAVDVRGPLTAQRGRLLRLLGSLSPHEWAAPTGAPLWRVKDIALHLLDVDLSWLASARDGDRSGWVSPATGPERFVSELDQRHQRWVDGAQALSPRLITALLRWSGTELDAYLATVDLARPSEVYWAGDAPLWFDLAREFTERWVHFRQIQEAVRGAEAEAPDEFLPLVLRTFIWGFPHQYREPAPVGTTVAVEISGVGAWTLTRAAAGWALGEGRPSQPAAGLLTSADAAWRLLTGAPVDPAETRLTGDQALAGPLLRVRGIIV